MSIINGDNGNNLLKGTIEDDLIRGLGGNDTLYGQDGNDSLEGGEDSDILSGQRGTDTLQGGNGDDTYIIDPFNDLNDTIMESANAGNGDRIEILTNPFFDPVEYTMAEQVEILNITGSGQFKIIGNTSNNRIVAFSNNENQEFSGQGGNDTLIGSNGDDTLDGGTGINALSGNVGNDTYIVNVPIDSQNSPGIAENAGQGTDIVKASVNFDLPSNVENLSLTGAANIRGGGNNGNNLIVGNEGKNLLQGGGGQDTLQGKGGEDTLDGGAGNDSLEGGEGNDTYLVNSQDEDTIIEDEDEGTDIVLSSVNFDLDGINHVENLTLTGNATIGKGNQLANLIQYDGSTNRPLNLQGSLGEDTLMGSNGNDTLSGTDASFGSSFSSDLLIGGKGDDTYIIDFEDVIIETQDQGNDTANLAGNYFLEEIQYQLNDHLENLVITAGVQAVKATGSNQNNLISGKNGTSQKYTLLGEGGDDTLEGGTIAEMGFGDSLDGGAGADLLEGFNGDDTLDGGSTDIDTLKGGEGNDTYIISDNIDDVIEETMGQGLDTVILSFEDPLGFQLSENVENLILQGNANFGNGNELANKIEGHNQGVGLFGFEGNDTLIGGNSDDLMDGGEGGDSLEGGQGNDRYIIDSSEDKIKENENEGIDTIQSSIGYTLLENIENLTLTGDENINGTGNALDNQIIGNEKGNNINGGEGNDTLIGRSGADFLSGSLGDDSLLGDEGFGSGGNDTLLGGIGNDILDGGEGEDVMQGGSGNDTYVIDDEGDVISDETSGLDTVRSFLSEYTLPNFIENLVVEVTIPDVGPLQGNNGTGNNTDNRIEGNFLANKLSGLDGEDTLIGGGGTDTLEGGMGNDEYRLDLQETEEISNTANFGTQITDTGGSADAIFFIGDKVNFSLEDMKRDETSLVIDINEDGEFTEEEDLTVLNFFTDSGEAGVGLIEKVGNLTGEEIIDFFKNPQPTQPTHPDFNMDGKRDLLWRNKVTGANTTWLMDNTTRLSFDSILSVTNLDWDIVGTGDADGDGKTDIYWRNQATGKNVVWYMDGANRTGFDELPPTVNTDWEIVGIGDVDNDSLVDDIYWRNKATAANVVWQMDGTTRTSSIKLQALANLDEKIVSIGDADNDGLVDDIYWRNQVTGANTIWLMNGTTFLSSESIPSVTNLDWDIVGTGDADGDGKTDIYWRNQATGKNVVWYMDGLNRTGSDELPTVANTDWQIVA